MVMLGKAFDGYTLPVIWFENIEYFDQFINAAVTMSAYFKQYRAPSLLPQLGKFIEQLDMSGI